MVFDNFSETGQRKAVNGMTLSEKRERDLFEEDEHTKLMKAERRAQLEAAFRKYDKDGSGYIDSREMYAVVDEAFPDVSDTVRKVYHDVMMREIDVNHDGLVQFQELLNQNPHGFSYSIFDRLFGMADKASRLEKEFRELDVNGSGSIDVPELRAILMRAFPEVPDSNIQRYMDAVLLDADQDHSGSLSQGEFFKSQYFYLLAMADEDPIVDKSTKLIAKAPKRSPLNKTLGYEGGMAQRCADLSPRRRNEEQLVSMSKCLTLSPRTKQVSPRSKLPSVERTDRDNFHATPELAGDILMQKAEAEIDKHSSGHQWHDAKEYFVDAAEAYLRDQEYTKAGRAYIRSGDCLGKLGCPIESAEAFVQAAQAFQYESPNDAIEALNEAIDIYEDHKRGKTVARLYKLIAELYESIGDYQNSIDYYLQAENLYGQEGQITSRAQCRKKVAQLYAQSSKYSDAIATYESVADMYFHNNLSGNPVLGRLEVKDFYFRAVICHLSQIENMDKGIDRITGIEKAKKAFERYTDLDVENFNSGLEYHLSKKLIEMSLKQDLVGMKAAIADYKDARRLDATEPWLAKLLDNIAISLDKWLEIAGSGV